MYYRGKRTVTVVMVFILLLSIFGVWGTAGGEGINDPRLAPYDPPITMTVGWDENSTVKYGEGESKTDNRWITKYRNELGINIEYAWYVPSEQYAEKVNVVIASGDIPDVMKVTPVQLAKLVDFDLVQEDLKPIFDEYVTPTQLLDYQNVGTAETFDAATYNGKLRAIPFAYSASGQGVNCMVLRRDWLDAVGMEAPKTFDELMAIYDAWSDMDFDGNGVADTVMFYADNTLNSLKRLASCFGAYPTFWLLRDGSLVYGSVVPEMKNALAKFNEMYAKGYLDPEFMVKDGGKAIELWTQNRCGSDVDLSAPWSGDKLIKSVEGSEIDCYPLPTATGSPARPMMTASGNDFYAISKSFTHPEAVVKMFCYQTEAFYGPDSSVAFYTEYCQDYDTGLSPFTWGPWFNVSVEKNYKTYKKFVNGEFDTLNPEQEWIWDTMVKYFEGGDLNQWAMARFFDINKGGHYLVLDSTLASGEYLLNGFYGAPLPSMVEYITEVDRIFDEMATKIITGDAPIDDFEKYVDQMNRAGLEQITVDVNEWYQNR